MIGCGASAPSAAVRASDARQRYHDGERWVEVEIVLDRLYLERAAAPGKAPIEVYLLRQPVASVAELDAVAQQIKAAQPDVRVVDAYFRSPQAPNAEPQRLTRQLVVRGSSGQNLDVLVVKHGARVVERLDYSPDTVIARATGPSLLAALASADGLRQEPGVVMAFPLIELRQHPRTR
jgi:hypothetical protein